jgi:hypothetical protein
MLQKVSDHVAICLARAAEAERHAAAASHEASRIDNERMAKTWRRLADSYEFADRLERFLLENDKRTGGRSSDNLDPAPLELDTPPMRDLRRVVDTIGRRNLLPALAAVCHAKAEEVGICEPVLGLEWLLLASDLEAFARARGGRGLPQPHTKQQ